MFKKIAIAATLAVLSTAASAADSRNFYVGGDLVSSKISGADDREGGFGAIGGYQFNSSFAAELTVRQLADYSYRFGGDRYDVSLNQVGVSAVGSIPLANKFSLFGRFGINRLSIVEDSNYNDIEETDHETKALFGIGVKYDFTPSFTGRLELQKPHGDITTLSAGLVYNFK